MTKSSGWKLALTLLVVTVAYGAFQARVLMQGPILTLESPVPGETIRDTLMEISGTTQNITHVLINGRPITMELSGAFTETLATPNGYGVILVEAENRFGHRTEQRIEFIGKPQPTNS